LKLQETLTLLLLTDRWSWNRWAA